LTLAGMAALPLVLGLAADHGIVVTHDLAHGMDLGVERAVLVASLTTLTGMGLLALAHHPALKAMGEVIFWGLLVEVPAALWLLPRLCRTAGTAKNQEGAA
jgi:predicted exporter